MKAKLKRMAVQKRRKPKENAADKQYDAISEAVDKSPMTLGVRRRGKAKPAPPLNSRLRDEDQFGFGIPHRG